MCIETGDFIPIEIKSLSSGLMFGIALYRNQPGISNKIIGQAGYALTAVVSIVEAVAALAFTALSAVVYPISSTFFKHSTTWLDSSAFCIGWSITNFFLSPIIVTLIADEKSARKNLERKNLLMVPKGAIF